MSTFPAERIEKAASSYNLSLKRQSRAEQSREGQSKKGNRFVSEPGRAVEPLPGLLLNWVGQEVGELSKKIRVVGEKRRHLLQDVLNAWRQSGIQRFAGAGKRKD